jgi:hypothetical protein
MSDEDLRKGYRALVSGGAFALGNEEITTVEGVLAETQRGRGLSPSVDQVAYLQEFVKISEEYITVGVRSGGFPTSRTNEKLEELNAKFPNLPEGIRRTEIIAPNIESNLYDEGWMSSSYQC